MTTAQVLSQVRVERLRLILETEQGKAVTYKEAEDLGFKLIHFFENLTAPCKEKE